MCKWRANEDGRESPALPQNTDVEVRTSASTQTGSTFPRQQKQAAVIKKKKAFTSTAHILAMREDIHR